MCLLALGIGSKYTIKVKAIVKYDKYGKASV